MNQFNRDAIDITNFSKKHYQELCDFIASEKPFVNDRISYVNGGVSYGGLDYNDNRHHISCNILATPALNEDGKNLNKIQEAVKNVATAKDLEHQALQALKKDDYYRPDQYTGTTKEDKALRSILHQEIESMKRRGLLKENAQTGALSVSKARDQEASR